MINFKKKHKKSVAKTYFMQLVFFFVAMFFVGAGAFAEFSQPTPETYKITLPQKVEGINKIEYVVDNKNMGSTSGKQNIDATQDCVLNFLVQVEPEGYSQLKAKDIKVNSKEGKPLNLMRYMYTRSGELTKVALSENDVIDPNQTYITSDYIVSSNDVLSINDLKKDIFKASITLDSEDYLANESLDISYTLGKDVQEQKPIYNEKTNSFEIQDITVGTPITLKINAKEDFSKSELEIFSGENQIIPFSDGSLTLPAIRSDIDVTIKNIHKNEYSLSFGDYEGLSFEYKKQGTNDDFAPATSEALKVIAGESYDIKCTAKGEDILANKEITANSVAIKKANDVYSISNIKEDIKVEITPVGDSYYKINLPAKGNGLTITDESGTNNIDSGKAKYAENFKFKIKAEEGYERNISDVLIYAIPTNKLENGDYDTEGNAEEAKKYLLAPSENDVYSISNVKEPISIIAKNLVKDSYRVRFPEGLVGASYKVEPSEGVSEISQNVFSVTRDSKVLVTLTADEGKTLENVTLGCNNSDIIVSKNENTYTIENITDDSNIVINNIEDKKCSVTFDSNGITCEDENGSVFSKNTMTLDYKGSQKFKIKLLSDGYTANSDITLGVKSGNAQLSKLPEENSYEISNVTENTELSVSGIQQKQLSIKLGSLDSSAVFTSTDKSNALPTINKVGYGDTLEFEVKSNNKEDQIYSITSSDKNSQIEKLDSSANKFALKNVSSNVTLSAVPVFTSENDTNSMQNEKNGILARNLADPENTRSGNSVKIKTSATPNGNGYFFYTPKSESLHTQKPFNVSCKNGSSGEYIAFGDDYPPEGTDSYLVEYTQSQEDEHAWIGYYGITYKLDPKEEGAAIENCTLFTGANHTSTSDQMVKVGRAGSVKEFNLNIPGNVNVDYSVENYDVRPSDSSESGELEASLVVKVTINSQLSLVDSNATGTIAIFRNLDIEAKFAPKYTGETVNITTKLTNNGQKYYFYPQNGEEHPDKLSSLDYSFYYNLDPYRNNAQYTDISDGQSRPNDSTAGNLVTYKKTDQGTWEGTYGIRFKAKSKFSTQLIENIKLFESTPHNNSKLIEKGKEYTGHYTNVATGGCSATYKILQCDSIHSTADPGTEELLLQIKITIKPDSTNDISGYASNYVRLFDHIDVSLKYTDEIQYNLDLFEQSLTFNSTNDNYNSVSALKFYCDEENVVEKTSDEIDKKTAMNVADASNIKLFARGTALPQGTFHMHFRVETNTDNTTNTNILMTPNFTYNTESGTQTDTLRAGGVYNIITASRKDIRWLSSCQATSVDVYNKVTLNIVECTSGETINLGENKVAKEFLITGLCTLEDYSCGSTDGQNDKIGNVFKGQEGQENDISCIDYSVGVPSVNSDVSFESTNSAVFKKIEGEDEELITEAINVPENNSLSFALYANAGYKFEAEYDSENLKLALDCVKIDGQRISQNNYTLTVTEYSPNKDYIKYKLEGITKNTLKVSINPYMIDYIKFSGTFGGKNSAYKTFEGISFDQHSFRYGEDNFGFIVNPSEEAQGDPTKCSIIIKGRTYDYTYPKAIGSSGEEFSTEDGAFSMRSTYTTRGIEIVLAGIKTDFKITFDYERKNIPLTFNTDGRFTYLIHSPQTLVDEGTISTTTQKQVKYGQNLSFSISSNNASVDISNITVTSNGVPVYMVNGKYTIKSITAEQTIEVTNISTVKNDVTFTKYDNVFFKDLGSNTYSEKVSVEYGNEIQFRVSTSDAYSESEGNVTVKAELASGTVLTFDSNDDESDAVYDKDTNSYTLKNIRENVRIYIQNLEPNKYTITLNDIEGIEYHNKYGTGKLGSYEQTVSHGNDFSFKVVAKEGYNLSNIKIYDQAGSAGNPVQIFPANDVYTISNISDNHIITAQDATVSTCTIEFRTLEGASYVDSSGNTIDSKIEVNYGTNYKFKLSLDKAYNKSTPTVNIKGVSKPLTKNTDGTYTIPNIKENKIIEMTNVTKNSYTATFKDAEGVIYKTAKNKPFTGTQQVEYDSNLYFKVSLMDAYDKSSPWVLLNGDKTLVENGGVYSLENIRDDVVVTVKNVVKNPEEVGISDISNIPEEVSSESDIDNVVKATKTYMSLSDEEKEQVTNVDDLKKAQENAGRLNHSSNDVEISGIDWNIKLIVNPLSDDQEQMKAFEEKIDRRSLFSLYEIHLLDLLTGKDYEVPYGQKVSVILPAPDLTGCTNEVVAHEKSSGSIEYLDLNIVDDRAQFQTSSFSMFGIAAKRIENYVENPSDMKISVNSLVDNEEELKSLLGDGLVSQLGKLIDDDSAKDASTDNDKNNNDGNGTENSDSLGTESTDGADAQLKRLLGGIDLEDTYNWMKDNELAAVIVILLVGSLLIWLLLALARKKKKEEEETKNK